MLRAAGECFHSFFEFPQTFTSVSIIIIVITTIIIIERFSIECRKTKTKPITYQLDHSANLKTKNQTQSNCLITFDTQLKTALILIIIIIIIMIIVIIIIMIIIIIYTCDKINSSPHENKFCS